MAIGRTWEESVQKALRMVDPFTCKGFEAAKGVEKLNAEQVCGGQGPRGGPSLFIAMLQCCMLQILDELVKPTDKRIFLISRVLKEGIYSVSIFPAYNMQRATLESSRRASTLYRS